MPKFSYYCKYCCIEFPSTFSYHRHMEHQHMDQELMKCDHCDYTTPLKADLKKHLESVHFPTFPPQTHKKRSSSSLPRKPTAEL